MWHWTRRILIGVVALIVAASLCGASYQAWATRRDLAAFSPPGKLVDVGGHRLHLWCTGSGSPTVILDSGLGGHAFDSDRSFTAEELSVAAWQQDKASFGLRSYENDYPDSNKLFKSIDSKGGLVAKGFIVKVGDRTFRLAAGGIAAASRLSPANPELQLKLERDLATAVNKLISHPVFAEWLADQTKPTKFSAAGQFWGIAPGTPARVVRDRIANIEATLNEALNYMETRGVTQLFREKDRVLCERRDIERCMECHSVLKQRFSKELSILLS